MMSTMRMTALATVAVAALATPVSAQEVRLSSAELDLITAGDLISPGGSTGIVTDGFGSTGNVFLGSAFDGVPLLSTGAGGNLFAPPPDPTPTPTVPSLGGFLGNFLGLVLGRL